jgi:hypothetical protein
LSFIWHNSCKNIHTESNPMHKKSHKTKSHALATTGMLHKSMFDPFGGFCVVRI